MAKDLSQRPRSDSLFSLFWAPVMPRLDNDAFLNALTQLYKVNAADGSVVVSMKRYVPKEGAEKNAAGGETCCLIRARDNRGTKVSTVVRCPFVDRGWRRLLICRDLI